MAAFKFISLSQIFPTLGHCFSSKEENLKSKSKPKFDLNFKFKVVHHDIEKNEEEKVIAHIFQSFSKIEAFMFKIIQHGLIFPILFFKFANEYYVFWNVNVFSINQQFLEGLFLKKPFQDKEHFKKTIKYIDDPLHQAFYQIVDADPLLKKRFSFCLLTVINYADMRMPDPIPIFFLNEKDDKAPKMVRTSHSSSSPKFAFDAARVDILASNLAYYWRRMDIFQHELYIFDCISLKESEIEMPRHHSSKVTEQDLLLDQSFFYSPAKSSFYQQRKNQFRKKRIKLRIKL